MDCRYDVMALYAARNNLRLQIEECYEIKKLAARKKQELQWQMKRLQEQVERFEELERDATLAMGSTKAPHAEILLKHRLQRLRNAAKKLGF